MLCPLGACATTAAKYNLGTGCALASRVYPNFFYRHWCYVLWGQCGSSASGKCPGSVPLRLQAKGVDATGVQLVFLYGRSGGSKWPPTYLLHLLPSMSPPSVIIWHHIGTCAMAPGGLCHHCCKVQPWTRMCIGLQSLSRHFL